MGNRFSAFIPKRFNSQAEDWFGDAGDTAMNPWYPKQLTAEQTREFTHAVSVGIHVFLATLDQPASVSHILKPLAQSLWVGGPGTRLTYDQIYTKDVITTLQAALLAGTRKIIPTCVAFGPIWRKGTDPTLHVFPLSAAEVASRMFGPVMRDIGRSYGTVDAQKRFKAMHFEP